MTTFAPSTPVAPEYVPADPAEQAGPVRDLALHVWRPTSTAVVVHVAGELDVSTTPRLHELLVPRLSSTAGTVVLDLSGLRFLGVVGLELVAHARRRAASRAMTVCLVDGPVCVDRALNAAGWSGTIPTYATVEEAVVDMPGRRRESPLHVIG
ncbi:anti-anti-sigma factor [Saccharopolyspora lacisalsi]|uniref:Anti-sigma factor antagonist n=1 Tax=Halosaccharopolyspora lacisalsi TaxID=1000566 RepID=A0A839DSG2_9PSEU|nr:anti-sigma factor antagonist [Halosaccharopolyspora lacisalsi]MBA8824932.1 anti-anti-sigma factor [Halosaccharopolyspora lacisalsi]